MPTHAFECLCPRVLFAGSATLDSSGVLRVLGDAADNQIVVQLSSESEIIVIFDGSGIGTFTLAQVNSMEISGLRGDDKLINQLAMPSTINGFSGNDTLIGGLSADTLNGGPGNDLLIPTSYLGLLDEDDVAQFNGGSGIDRIDYAIVESPISVSVFQNSTIATPIGISREPDLVASDVELLQMGVLADRVYFGSGTFLSFDGRSGNDEFTLDVDYVAASGASRPVIFGGSGNDRFFFSSAPSGFIMDGGSGNDVFEVIDDLPTIMGGSGDDVVSVSTVLSSGSQTVDLHNSNGVERFSGIGRDMQRVKVHGPDDSAILESAPDAASVTLIGGEGNDTLLGSAGNDSLIGSVGNDFVDGAKGDDTLRGGAGNDTLIGGAGKDKLYGDAGDDLLLGRGGSKDRLDGGDGTDTATADVGPSVIDLVLNVEDVN